MISLTLLQGLFLPLKRVLAEFVIDLFFTRTENMIESWHFSAAIL